MQVESFTLHPPPLRQPIPLCLITCFLIRNPPHLPNGAPAPFALEEDTHRESVKLIKISTHDFALLLYDSAFVCLHRQREGVGWGWKGKGQQLRDEMYEGGGGGGGFSCLWIFQSQKDTQLETFNTLTANWIRIQIIHPPLFPPLSLPLAHLPLLILFFPLFFSLLALRQM